MLRAGSARDYVFPLGDGLPSAVLTKQKKFLQQVTVLHSRQRGSPRLLLVSDNSFSRKSPCCALCRNSIRTRLVGTVNCSINALNGRRFSYKLSGVTEIVRRLSFPVIYTGCSFANAIIRKLIGPCIVVAGGNIEVNLFKLSPRLSKLITRTGDRNIAFHSPVTATGRVTSVLHGGRGYSIIVYIDRLK